jgi:hypothetical protein
MHPDKCLDTVVAAALVKLSVSVLTKRRLTQTVSNEWKRTEFQCYFRLGGEFGKAPPLRVY